MSNIDKFVTRSKVKTIIVIFQCTKKDRLREKSLERDHHKKQLYIYIRISKFVFSNPIFMIIRYIFVLSYKVIKLCYKVGNW